MQVQLLIRKLVCFRLNGCDNYMINAPLLCATIMKQCRGDHSVATAFIS